jgi:Predicted nucleotide-binding protein containing TIR-like domain
MNAVNQVVVFFAWQTDSPGITNRYAIRHALKFAAKKLKKEFAYQKIAFDLQEATRGEPGSPNIPQTILKKIEASDIFVCDLTTAVEQSTLPAKASPNPNVVFELGFAVAHLGWSRVIMVFNEAFGVFPDDLPFDLDRQRASRYQIREDPDASKDSARAELESLLTDALRVILKTKPARPAELKGLSVGQIQRNRDLESLRWLLSTIHWPSLDEHMDEGPGVIQDRIFHFWEGFNSVITNSLFHLYDKSLRSKAKKIHQLWGRTLSYDSFYRPSRTGDRHFFDTHMDMFRSDEQRNAWKDLNSAYLELRRVAKGFLTEVRQNFTELDLRELNKAAFDEYCAFQKEIAKTMGAEPKPRLK